MAQAAIPLENEHHRRLERMYIAAPINEFYKPRVSISNGHAEITIDVRPEFFHAANAVHGSVYFKMLDDAAFFACNSLLRDSFVLTASFTTHLERPVTGGTLRSVGKVIRPGNMLFLAESILFDGDGLEVARGTGTFVRSNITLSALEGYAAAK